MYIKSDASNDKLKSNNLSLKDCIQIIFMFIMFNAGIAMITVSIIHTDIVGFAAVIIFIIGWGLSITTFIKTKEKERQWHRKFV